MALGDCTPASKGFVLESIAELAPTDGATGLRLVRDPKGQLYLAYAELDGLHVMISGALDWHDTSEVAGAFNLRHYVVSWPMSDASSALEYPPDFVLAFAPDGTPHLAYAYETTFVASASDAGWLVEEAPFRSASPTALLVSGDGERWLAANDWSEGASLAHQTSAGWDLVPLSGRGVVRQLLVSPSESVVALSGDTSAGAIFDPLSLATTDLGGAPTDGVVIGDELRVVTWDREPSIHLQTFPNGATSHDEVVWRAPQGGPYETSDASLVIDVDGASLVVHRTPEGVVLSRSNSDGVWSAQTVTSERGAPLAALDAKGKVEVYLLADSDWNGFPDQIRRVRAGTCP